MLEAVLRVLRVLLGEVKAQHILHELCLLVATSANVFLKETPDLRNSPIN